MNGRVTRWVCGWVAAGLLLAVAAPAQARPPYKKEFDAKYAKADGTEIEKALAAKAEKAKCNICHKGKSKKDRNAYGEALSQFLKKEDEKDLEKIRASLDKVSEMKSKKDDDKSPTFGELIKNGDLPGGEEAK